MKSLEMPIVITSTPTFPRQETVSQLKKRAVIPAKAGIQFDFIQIFEILDARFREHDKLQHSLQRRRGIPGLESYLTLLGRRTGCQ